MGTFDNPETKRLGCVHAKYNGEWKVAIVYKHPNVKELVFRIDGELVPKNEIEEFKKLEK